MMFDETETVGALFAVTQTVGLRMLMRVVCSGAKCVIIPEGTSFDEMVEAVRRHKITTLFASTTSIHRLATHMIESGIRLPSVRNVVIIAVRVTEKAAETIFSAFCLKSFRSMYGTTELSNVISWMPRDTMEHKTIGFPAPDVQMMVVDIDTGNVLGPKEHGELWVKSPTNMRAYYNNPDATAEVITPEGWLRTGDIAYYDETGRFYVVERIKQFFHCMGRQVAQSEIEGVLLSHEGVEEAAVIDVPHPEYTDVAKAFVVLKPSYRGPGRTRTQELQQFVAACYKRRIPIDDLITPFLSTIPDDTAIYRGQSSRSKKCIVTALIAFPVIACPQRRRTLSRGAFRAAGLAPPDRIAPTAVGLQGDNREF
ncbi:hypothetical protein HPB47_009393 [Ixodes persulcatus]|uniref:Uncharacterized protein n=1 Tax=Ixodes persulcatus TaxID=34615 RepID=A0AC60P209_IXOPE|nr:hypothetical protein HPB47_009393 [Ixodes persulcatus]